MDAILANGDYPHQAEVVQDLLSADYVVCCDGAAERFLAEGHIPDAIIGDGDSLPPALKMRYRQLFIHEAEQATNDLSKAFRLLMRRGSKTIRIFGATGKREDHTLGNISLLMDYMDQCPDIRMLTDHGIFIPCNGSNTFSCKPGVQVSVFNFGCNLLTCKGLAYPVRPFTNWWQGTLNECTAGTFSIEADGKYLVYMAHIS